MARYNTRRYNKHQYNAGATALLLELSDSIVSVDVLSKTVVSGIIPETLIPVDTLIKNVSSSKTDFLNIIDNTIEKVIDVKGLADDVDLDLWLTIDRNDNNSKFTEQ